MAWVTENWEQTGCDLWEEVVCRCQFYNWNLRIFNWNFADFYVPINCVLLCLNSLWRDVGSLPKHMAHLPVNGRCPKKLEIGRLQPLGEEAICCLTFYDESSRIFNESFENFRTQTNYLLFWEEGIWCFWHFIWCGMFVYHMDHKYRIAHIELRTLGGGHWS